MRWLVCNAAAGDERASTYRLLAIFAQLESEAGMQVGYSYKLVLFFVIQYRLHIYRRVS